MEMAAMPLQLRPDLQVVIELSVIGDVVAAIDGGHRLMATLAEIKNGEPLMAKNEPAGGVLLPLARSDAIHIIPDQPTVIIRAAVPDQV